MAEPLKNMVDRQVVAAIAERVGAEAPRFDAESFVADLWPELTELELKPRFEAIARRLRVGLGDDYREALEVLVRVAQAEPPIEGFAAWPLCTFVELFGVNDPEHSLPAIEHLTKRASCEFAVRPFLRDHWQMTYDKLVEFTSTADEAVRRLASEGSRPRLPWGLRVPRLIEDPRPGLDLLELLRHDPSETVRRSVANHLNDVGKDHPNEVVETVRRWVQEPATDPKMVSHALRTLVKQGNSEALTVLGFTTEPALEVTAFFVRPDLVGLGDRIELTCELRSTSTESQGLVVDFIIHHVNASGATSPKVFKWTTLQLDGLQSLSLTKRRMIQNASTRTYNPGQHRVELQIAGEVVAETSFDLTV
ncbi:MAG: DNA alkylation repair protein [Acidimicrobiia bacterium]